MSVAVREVSQNRVEGGYEEERKHLPVGKRLSAAM